METLFIQDRFDHFKGRIFMLFFAIICAPSNLNWMKSCVVGRKMLNILLCGLIICEKRLKNKKLFHY